MGDAASLVYLTQLLIKGSAFYLDNRRRARRRDSPTSAAFGHAPFCAAGILDKEESQTPRRNKPSAPILRKKAKTEGAQVEEIKSAIVRNVTARTSN